MICCILSYKIISFFSFYTFNNTLCSVLCCKNYIFNSSSFCSINNYILQCKIRIIGISYKIINFSWIYISFVLRYCVCDRVLDCITFTCSCSISTFRKSIICSIYTDYICNLFLMGYFTVFCIYFNIFIYIISSICILGYSRYSHQNWSRNCATFIIHCIRIAVCCISKICWY